MRDSSGKYWGTGRGKVARRISTPSYINEYWFSSLSRAESKPEMQEAKRKRARRKDARPSEILEAARKCFVENGFAATRIGDVAKRAGVSAGTVYLYYEHKEALFEAVVRDQVLPIIDHVIAAIRADAVTPAPEQLRFIFQTMYRELVATDRRKLLHLIIAEGVRFPWLTEFYHREILSKGIALLTAVLKRGEERGEIRPGAVGGHPEMLVGPVILAALFTLLFAEHAPLDLDEYANSHIEFTLSALAAKK